MPHKKGMPKKPDSVAKILKAFKAGGYKTASLPKSVREYSKRSR